MSSLPTTASALRWTRPRIRIPGSPIGLMIGAVLVVIVFLVVYPIIRSIMTIGTSNDTNSWLDGMDSSLLGVVANTLIVVGGGSVIALVVGAVLALLNERTDGGIRGLGDFMPIAPLMLPSITGVIGWVVLLEPNIGLVNIIARRLLGMVGIQTTTGPFNIYSMWGLIALTALHVVPLVYLVVAPALRNLDPGIEEASRICGSKPLRTALKVTLPAIRPALVSAWVLAVINCVSLFSVPVIIGTGARIDVLSVRIWRYLVSYPPQQGAALVLAGCVLLVLVGLRLVQQQIEKSGQQSTIGGKGMRAAPTKLGRWRWLTRSVVGFYIASAVVLPVIGLLIIALSKFWSATISWSELGLQNFKEVIDKPSTFHAMVNSLELAAIAASITMFLAGLMMLYVSQRNVGGGNRRGARRSGERRGLRRMIDVVTTLPATIPHSLIGVSFILGFSAGPFYLYGTMTMLLLAHFVMQIPYAAASASAAVSVVGTELGEASRICGATERRTMRKILLPLIIPGLVAGWVIVFIHVLGEVTASALLSSPANPVVGAQLLDLWIQGQVGQTTAMAILVWLLSSILVLILLRISKWRTARITG